jgi:acyl-CoA synthetase (AMP-forming)/AMP-acid ligase II
MFGAALAGAVFVPVNPLLKPEQVAYILADCNVRVLVTSASAGAAGAGPGRLPDLRTVFVTGAPGAAG